MGNFTLGRYLPLDSPVHKMDPRAKIIAMLVMLIAVFIPAGWIGYGVIFVVAASTINYQCVCDEDRKTISSTR